MIPGLPLFIPVVFTLTTILTLIFFFFAMRKSHVGNSKRTYVIAGLIAWLFLQAIMSLNNFYNTDTAATPPKFLFLVIPPFLAILILFITRAGRRFIDSLSLTQLTYIHVVRIAVELVLYWLFLNKAVPELMTFSGRNFDILAGITAPFIAYFGLQKHTLKRRSILLWNFIALLLLLNIVINAILSAPFAAIQKFAFEQPNIAVLYFPFSWLPGFIVPVVLLAHLASIRQLAKQYSVARQKSD